MLNVVMARAFVIDIAQAESSGNDETIFFIVFVGSRHAYPLF